MEKPLPVPIFAASSATHLGYLDGLRGLAAVFVVLHHAYLQVAERAPLPGFLGQAVSPLGFGRYAVDLFIVLSGFCLMLPINKGNGTLRGGAWKFFQRRAWRILPTYLLALIFSLVMAKYVVNQKTGTHWDISIPFSGRSVVAHFLLLQDVINQGFTINHAFWSIAVEWRIYFLFPLLLLLWRKWGGINTTLFAIFFSLALFVMCRKIEPQGLTAYYIGLFAMGMLASSIALSSEQEFEKLRKIPWHWMLLLSSLAVIVVSKAQIWHGGILPISVRDEFLGFWTMCLLIVVSQSEKGTLYRILGYKPLVFLGTFAYSIYLIHAPLLQVFWQYVFVPLQNKPSQMFVALALIATPLIIGMSYVFFLLCERPFLKRKAKAAVPLAVTTALEPAP